MKAKSNEASLNKEAIGKIIYEADIEYGAPLFDTSEIISKRNEKGKERKGRQ